MKRIGNINGKVVVLGTHNRTTSKYIEITSEFMKQMNTLGTWKVDVTPVEIEVDVEKESTPEETETTKKTSSKKKVLTEEELGL